MRRRDNGESGCEVFADSHPWYGVMDMTGSDPVMIGRIICPIDAQIIALVIGTPYLYDEAVRIMAEKAKATAT